MRITLVMMSLMVIAIACSHMLARAEDSKAGASGGKSVPPVLNFTMKSLAGDDVNLAQYQGKVVLIVNTASKCGFTPQYKDLEELYTKYKDKGLVILGFPRQRLREAGAGK